MDSIIKNGFKNGINNAHANCDDKYHPGRKIGNSVYVTPNISTCNFLLLNFYLSGEKYSILFL